VTRIFGSWKTSQQRPEPHRNTSEVSLPWLNQRSIRAQHSTLHQIKWVQGTAPISWQVLNLVQFFFRTFPVKARLVSIYHCINSHIMIYYDISAKNIKWFHIVQHLSKIGPFCIILHHSASFCISDISPFPLSFLFFYFVSSTFMGGADGPWATGLSLSLQRRGAQASTMS